MTCHREACFREAMALKERIAALEAEVKNWTDTAAQFHRNQLYYAGLIDEAAKIIGLPMYTADDAGVHPEPLRAKLPECVLALEAENEALRKDAERYRYVRDKSTPIGICTWDEEGLKEYNEWKAIPDSRLVDAVIDATMKESK